MALASTTGASSQAQQIAIIDGSGFAPNEAAVVTLKDPLGHVVTSSTITIGVAGTIPAGATVALPSGSRLGTYAVSVKGLQSLTAAGAVYHVSVFTPTLTVNPTSGGPGTLVTASGTGMMAGEYVAIRFGSVTVATVACAVPKAAAFPHTPSPSRLPRNPVHRP